MITGANGFVGLALSGRLSVDGWPIRAVVRTHRVQFDDIESAAIGDINGDTDWANHLRGVDRVVHLAARVHVMTEQSVDPYIEYHRVNVDGTLNLARQAAAAGVRRFVFLSSVKVNGETTQLGQPFTTDDVPKPEDPYGVSKLKAEQELQKIAERTGMEVVIIRSPLVYGLGVKANFQRMMHWLAHGFPLPLANVHKNRRSLVALDNLVDLIATCLRHPAAANQTFFVSDGEDLSTVDLLQRMSSALGKPVRLFPVSLGLLKFGAAVLEKQSIYQRLCGSLQVDITKTQRMLNWTPPVTVDEGLRRAVQRSLV